MIEPAQTSQEVSQSRIERWMHKKGEKHLYIWLAFISFAESSFFPLPPDPFLLVATCRKPNNWLKYALWISFWSIIGGIGGYIIGYYFFGFFGQKIIDIYSLQTQFTRVGELFTQNEFFSIFVSAFTPIPYKIFTIAGGFFKINIFKFILASFFGRSLRFILVSFLAKMFGKKYGKQFLKYLDIFMITLVILLVLYSLHSFI